MQRVTTKVRNRAKREKNKVTPREKEGEESTRRTDGMHFDIE